jgi:hypothetical protein
MMGNSKVKYLIIGIIVVVVIYLAIYISVSLMKRSARPSRPVDTGISVEQEQRLVDFSETRTSAGGAEKLTAEQKKRLEAFYKSRQ